MRKRLPHVVAFFLLSFPGSMLVACSDQKGAPEAAPFTGYDHQIPGAQHKITVADLPEPNPAQSIDNGPKTMVPRPKDGWPKAPAGFKVEQFATGLENPRLIRTAPNGYLFLAESSAGKIKVFRGMTADGKGIKSQNLLRG